MSDQAASFSSSSSLPLPGSKAVFPSPLASAECCEEHDEYLSLFCLDDLEPLCKHCAADSHARHRVYLSAEAVTDCKEELKTSLTGLDVKIKNFKDVMQACRAASKCNQTNFHLTEEIMKEEFEKLHQFLREEEAARLHALMEEEEEKSRKAAERINRLNEVMTSLEDKIRLTERELRAGGEGTEYLQEYQDTLSSTWCGNAKPERIHRPLINVAKHLGNLRHAVWEKMKQIAPYTPVTLDPGAAGRAAGASSSELSRFHVTAGPRQSAEQLINEPEHLHPHPRILAREGFDTGVHCWDVEVGETNRWTVGVAAQSALKTVTCEASPEAGLWCIRLKDGEYQALTTPTQTLDVGTSRRLNRVRVKLDLEGGAVTFVDADTDAPLFTFTHCFAEAVYPYFEASSAGGGVAVREQRVKISLESEDRPAKGNSPTENGTTAEIARETDAEKKSAELCCAKKEESGKPERKEKTPNARHVKKQSRKSRFNVSYHVSLNKALSDAN
ncbi:zinc-binding protein A33-like isoform X1 [Poecilia latipinna]|uniref:zinc-binding protein A33-like isoform X1 n=2 Tax=Poecilia latipinna TaxID=48699 RepID=UPI00072DE6F2|nr:PREDICTED: zinc-binding protein A33-like isoform X1 [Poecilia latipinna]